LKVITYILVVAVSIYWYQRTSTRIFRYCTWTVNSSRKIKKKNIICYYYSRTKNGCHQTDNTRMNWDWLRPYYDTIVLICSSNRIHPRRRAARAVRRPVQRTNNNNNKGPVSSVVTHWRGRDHIFTSLFLTLRFFLFSLIFFFT
jgi:hypothetical protein